MYSAASSGNINALKGAVRLSPDTLWNQCSGRGYGSNALLVAVSRDFYSGMRYLLQEGANPNVRCNGYSALHLAVKGNDPTATQILLEYNANPNIRDDHGRSPLFYASYNIAKKLLARGADVQMRDEEGSSPMIYALRNGKNTAQLLEKYGADRRTAQAVVNRENASKTDVFDLAMKSVVTAGVAGTVAASNIDAYHGADIISATAKDIWIEGEEGNLARLNQQYNKGDFSIQNESIAKSYHQQQEHEAAIRKIQQDAQRQAAEKRAAEQRAIEAKARMAKRQAEQQLAQQKVAEQKAIQRRAVERQAVEKKAAEEEARKLAEQKLAKEEAARVAKVKAEKDKQKFIQSSSHIFQENSATYKLGSIKAGEAKEIKGELSRRNIKVGNTHIASITVRYALDHFIGEPLVKGSWKWTSKDNDASLPSGFSIWLKIVNGSSYGYIRLSPAVPKANGDFGFNEVAASPNWDDYICSFEGDSATGCMMSDLAKKVYKGGRVTGFELSHR